MLLGRFALPERGSGHGNEEQLLQNKEQEPSAYWCHVIFSVKALGSQSALLVFGCFGGVKWHLTASV